MNELKPEDVMKALECCADKRCYGTRDSCPLFDWNDEDDAWVCTNKLCKAALALLREKDALIAKHEAYIDTLNEDKEYLVTQIADLQQMVLKKDDHIKQLHSDIRATVELANKGAAEKDAEIERLNAYNENLLCANTDITNRHKDYVEEAERIARRDAITEFSKRTEEALTAQVNVSSNEMLAAFMWCLDLVKNLGNELKGETDGKSDL